MSIGVNTLTNCVNAVLQSEQQPLPIELLQVASVGNDYREGFVYSVANVAALPAAADNTGRMVFVEDQQRYFISDGVVWTSDLNSSASTALYGWGCNGSSRLGADTTANRSSPASVVGGFTDWCQVSASYSHTVAVKTNGTLWAWGSNSNGRLGDGSNTLTNRSSPVAVAGGFTDWCQVATGLQHTAAVRTNGTAWTWGSNGSGQLGDGTTTSRSSPVSVVGGFTDWCQVSAGSSHAVAVRTNGTLWAWGINFIGHLGDGTTTDRSSPVSVVGGFTDWCQVSNDSAVRTNGTLWTWGYNNDGRLGDGTTTARSSPVSVIGGFTDWCQVSGGRAVRTNGTLWAWGDNNRGQLGDNTTTNRSSPVVVAGGFTDWCQVSAGSRQTAAVRTNGTLWAWGCNDRGQLGDGTVGTNRSSPVVVAGGFTDWCQVSAGSRHTAAVRFVKAKGF